MTKFVLAYHGGGGMPETEEEQQQVMEAWGGWFASMGDAVVDGGNPFAASKTIAPDGAVSDGGSRELSGYTVIQAGDLDSATNLAKGCPVLTGGGTVDVYEAIDM